MVLRINVLRFVEYFLLSPAVFTHFRDFPEKQTNGSEITRAFKAYRLHRNSGFSDG